MKQSVLLLDIDGTILPNYTYEHDNKIEDDFNYEMLRNNIRRLIKLSKEYNLGIVIISSMSNHMLHSDDIGIGLKEGYVCKHDERAINIIINEMLKLDAIDVFIGVSNGNKASDIKSYIADKSIDKVIVLEDTDFSSSCNPNNGSHYIRMNGFVSGGVVYRIKQILGVTNDSI